MKSRGSLLLHGKYASLSASEPHQSDDRDILLQEKRAPSPHLFNQDVVLKSGVTAISEVATDLTQRILEDFNSIMPIVEKRKACYRSSLLVHLFLRRVVEMYIMDKCYPKVRMTGL